MGADAEKQFRRIEITSTILLALATLAITWCSYQSAIWNSSQTFRLAEFNALSRLSQQETGIVRMRQEIDASMALDFMSAVLEKRQERIHYYLSRSRPDFRTILKQWMDKDPVNNTHAPPHPLAMPEYDKMLHGLMAPADSASDEAQIKWQLAREANTISDYYVLTTVVFSLVMFLVAKQQRNDHLGARKVTAADE